MEGVSPFGLPPPPPPPWFVGHRGAAAEAPENTVESFRLAAEQGADLVELDLRLTGDGTLVACHDADLMRVAGSPLAVETASLAELRGAGAALPKLDEILAALPPGLPLNLELKRDRAPRLGLAESAAGTLAGRGRPILVSSFDWPLLAALSALRPALPIAPLASRDGAALVAAGERLGAWSLHAHRRLATPWLASAARDAGRPLLVYTVNDAAEAARLLDLGVTGLFTDAPGRLRRDLAASRGPGTAAAAREADS